ncbi:phosphatidylinositol-3,5-bisphosphate 3-phosphatase MTMR3-like isoform X3 [Tachypleus tridentatus]
MACSEVELHSYKSSESQNFLVDSRECDWFGNLTPFSMLPGERISRTGLLNDGVIVLTNYRLFTHSNKSVFTVPLGLIDYTECQNVSVLYLFCKDARSFSCNFATSEECQKWLSLLLAAYAPPQKLEEVFAFSFFQQCYKEQRKDVFLCLQQSCQYIRNNRDDCSIVKEAKRMGFDLHGTWRVTHINRNFRLCSSYPQFLLIPASLSDKELEAAAKFRFSRRIPTIVWRHRKNSTVIARSSQPSVGWLGWRSQQDEHLLQAIIDAYVIDSKRNPTLVQNSPEVTCQHRTQSETTEIQSWKSSLMTNKLWILDARSYTAAVANRAKGGGCECPEYYPNCEIKFLNLANIHSIRKSFHSLRILCMLSTAQETWLSSLENTRWLHYISDLLNAALVVVNSVDIDHRPVLVHCSDGWDRTPQIVALAELMLDPFYRTFEGFRILVEKEWLDFGHKFCDRCGTGPRRDDPSEKSPVFLQWLDCVNQLLHQFPCEFEFNQQYLLKLAEHSFSNLFGTFLCNTAQQRQKECVNQQTFSVWAYLNSKVDAFLNYLFIHNKEILRPSCRLNHLVFWEELYIRPEEHLTFKTGGQIFPLLDFAKPKKTYRANSYESLTQVQQKNTIYQQRCCSDSSIGKNMKTFNHNIKSVKSSLVQSQPESKQIRLTAQPLWPKDDSFVEKDDNLVLKHKKKCMCLTTIEQKMGNTCICEAFQEPLKKETESVWLDKTAESSFLGCLAESCFKHKPHIGQGYGFQLHNCLPIGNIPSMSNDGKSTSEFVSGTIFPSSFKSTVEQQTSSNNNDVSLITRSEKTFKKETRTNNYIGKLHDMYFINTINMNGDFGISGNLDGLGIFQDKVQMRLQEIAISHEAEVGSLRQEIIRLKHKLIHSVEQHLAYKTHSKMRSSPELETDQEWEKVEKSDVSATLWVPDHAVTHCMSCGNKFGFFCRKHHCRHCGKVFCNQCCNRMTPVPREKLFSPVRVCQACYDILHSPTNSY